MCISLRVIACERLCLLASGESDGRESDICRRAL